MIQTTSIEAYRENLAHLGDRQRQVLDAMHRYGKPVTNKELSRMVGLEINSVTPRIFELRSFGLVEEAGIRPCKISGRKAIAWKVADPPSEDKQTKLF